MMSHTCAVCSLIDLSRAVLTALCQLNVAVALTVEQVADHLIPSVFLFEGGSRQKKPYTYTRVYCSRGVWIAVGNGLQVVFGVPDLNVFLRRC